MGATHREWEGYEATRRSRLGCVIDIDVEKLTPRL